MDATSIHSHFELLSRGKTLFSMPLESLDGESVSEILAVEELHQCGFRVTNRNSDWEYSVAVGDDPLEAPSFSSEHEVSTGVDLAQDVVWADGWPFESCVGVVHVSLNYRKQESSTPWTRLACLRANVWPSKLGMQRYDALARDIREVSASLIFDLISKNKMSVRFPPSGITVDPPNIQLRRIETLWSQICDVLGAIKNCPATTVCRKLTLVAHGQPIDSFSAAKMVGRGIVPTMAGGRLQVWRSAESSVIYEHSLIKAILLFLSEQVDDCRERALKQALHLAETMPVWLDPDKVKLIIESEYRPRIERLHQLAEGALQLRKEILTVVQDSPFSAVSPARELMFTPIFQGVLPYRAFFLAIAHYLRSCHWRLEEGITERIKRTS